MYIFTGVMLINKSLKNNFKLKRNKNYEKRRKKKWKLLEKSITQQNTKDEYTMSKNNVSVYSEISRKRKVDISSEEFFHEIITIL